MTNETPVCLWQVEAELAEGPIWHRGERAIYFVDVKKHQIHRCNETGTERKSWNAPQQLGFIVPAIDGNFICGLQDGLYYFSTTTAQFTRCNDVERDIEGNRLNDGYVDSTGVLWFGSMDESETRPSGALYSMDKSGVVTSHDHNYVITNGPVKSPDGCILYHTDTVNKSIFAFDVGLGNHLTNKRLFVKMNDQGHPDGMAVDADGFVWVAIFGGWRIDRFSPDGRRVATVAFPCANITKLAFGGADLRTVFVTTARKGLSAEELTGQPLAGGLFSFWSDTPGLPQQVFSPEF
jgi:sugar lactone lactonase YvrE